jgi:hypothetical protein
MKFRCARLSARSPSPTAGTTIVTIITVIVAISINFTTIIVVNHIIITIVVIITVVIITIVVATKSSSSLPSHQAPHTEAASKLKEFVTTYSFEEEEHWEDVGRHSGLADHGYIESVFPVVLRPENNPQENYDYNILYGYVYKKDKKSDHVPIPMAKALGSKKKMSRCVSITTTLST